MGRWRTDVRARVLPRGYDLLLNIEVFPYCAVKGLSKFLPAQFTTAEQRMQRAVVWQVTTLW